MCVMPSHKQRDPCSSVMKFYQKNLTKPFLQIKFKSNFRIVMLSVIGKYSQF